MFLVSKKDAIDYEAILRHHQVVHPLPGHPLPPSRLPRRNAARLPAYPSHLVPRLLHILRYRCIDPMVFLRVLHPSRQRLARKRQPSFPRRQEQIQPVNLAQEALLLFLFNHRPRKSLFRPFLLHRYCPSLKRRLSRTSRNQSFLSSLSCVLFRWCPLSFELEDGRFGCPEQRNLHR